MTVRISLFADKGNLDHQEEPNPSRKPHAVDYRTREQMKFSFLKVSIHFQYKISCLFCVKNEETAKQWFPKFIGTWDEGEMGDPVRKIFGVSAFFVVVYFCYFCSVLCCGWPPGSSNSIHRPKQNTINCDCDWTWMGILSLSFLSGAFHSWTEWIFRPTKSLNWNWKFISCFVLHLWALGLGWSVLLWVIMVILLHWTWVHLILWITSLMLVD